MTARWWRRARVDVLLAFAVLAVTAPFVQDLTAQPASRYALTAAIWDHHTVGLDRYEHVLGVDRANYKGHTYSDKAPGQPVLAVPVYAAYRALGGEPATHRRIHRNLGLWLVTLWSAGLPAAGLAVLVRHAARRADAGAGVATGAALALGTLVAVFATTLYGHVLAAFLGFAAYLLATGPRLRTRRLVAAGALAGAAVLVEYPLALLAGGLFLLVLVRERQRVGWFVLGAVPPAVALAAYQWLAFDSPLRTSYRYSGDADQRGGIAGIHPPVLHRLGAVLIGDRGLLLLTPVVAVAVIGGLIVLVRRNEHGRLVRLDAAAGLAVLALYVVVQAGWKNPWGGEMPGPRFVIPALPFLAVPLAGAWRRLRPLVVVSAVVGAAVMLLAASTSYLVSINEHALDVWLTMARRGEAAPTVATMLLGNWGWLLHGALVAVAGTALWRTAEA